MNNEPVNVETEINKFDREKIIEFILKQIPTRKLSRFGDRFWEREIQIYFCDGYGSRANRTVLFCVEGSPNKFMGFYDLARGDGYRKHLVLSTSLGEIKIPFKKIEALL